MQQNWQSPSLQRYNHMFIFILFISLSLRGTAVFCAVWPRPFHLATFYNFFQIFGLNIHFFLSPLSIALHSRSTECFATSSTVHAALIVRLFTDRLTRRRDWINCKHQRTMIYSENWFKWRVDNACLEWNGTVIIKITHKYVIDWLMFSTSNDAWSKSFHSVCGMENVGRSS